MKKRRTHSRHAQSSRLCSMKYLTENQNGFGIMFKIYINISKAIFILFFLFLKPLAAQPIGKIVNESGIVIYRDESLSDNKFVRAITFKSFIDRRSEGNIDMGYIVFSQNEITKQVWAKNIVDIFFDRELNPNDLENENQFQEYLALKSKIEEASKINLVIQPFLEKVTSQMEDYISKYKNQNVLRNGKWISREQIRILKEKKDEEEKIQTQGSIIQDKIRNMNNLSDSMEIKKNIDDIAAFTTRYNENIEIKKGIVENLKKSYNSEVRNVERKIENQKKEAIALEKEKAALAEYEKMQRILQERQEAENKKEKEKRDRMEALGL